MEKLLGGSLPAVIFRLVILSILTGIILAALGLQPADLVAGVKSFIQALYAMGFGVFETAFGYFLAGAVIVIPIWFISRLFRAKSLPSSNKADKADK